MATTPLHDVTRPLDTREAEAELALAQGQLRTREANIEFQAEQQVRSYRIKQRELAARRQALAIEDRRLLVMRQQLRLGELKENDLLRAQTERLQGEIALLEQVLDLRLQEREIEKVSGLQAGQLELL